MYFHDENKKGNININKKGKTFTLNKFAITVHNHNFILTIVNVRKLPEASTVNDVTNDLLWMKIHITIRK